MSRWNNLPHEILLRIFDKLDHEPRKNKWMFVNRQCHGIYQCIAYKSISIELDLKDRNFAAIIQSPFKPGKWVKTINFKSLNTPANSDQFKSSSSSLYTVMMSCPNVTSVEFSEGRIDGRDWAYFAATLMKNETWKLSSLPTLYNKSEDFSSYFNCALNLKHSLEALILTHVMIRKSNYDILREFKKLTMLTAGRGVLKYLADCDAILEYLPQLTSLLVDGFQANLYVSSNTLTSKHYPNVINLALNRYTPLKEEEFAFIMNRFQNLNELVISGNADKTSWPATVINLSAINSFFEYIQKISTFDITLVSPIGKYLILDAYSTTRQTSINSFGLAIDFRNKCPDHYSLKFQRTSSYTKISLSYSEEHNHSARLLLTKKALSHNSFSNIQTIIVDLCKHRCDIEDYMDTILSTKNIKLQKMIFMGGKLESYSPTKEIENINRLVFGLTEICHGSLKHLSKDFPKLESLDFVNCNFLTTLRGAAVIMVSMVQTTIGAFKLIQHQEVSSILLISVYFNDLNSAKYYMSVASESDKTVEEIKSSTRQGLRLSLLPEQYTIISLQFKLVSLISLELSSRNGTHHAVELSFP